MPARGCAALVSLCADGVVRVSAKCAALEEMLALRALLPGVPFGDYTDTMVVLQPCNRSLQLVPSACPCIATERDDESSGGSIPQRFEPAGRNLSSYTKLVN